MAYPATASLPQSGSIVSRWLLDEVSGNRADSVGTNTLTDNNTVASGTGYANATSGVDFVTAADFEKGNSEYLNRADNAGLSITGSLSMSFWWNPETVAATSYALMGKWRADSNARSYLLNYGSTSKFEFILSSNGTATKELDSVTTPTISTWVWVTVVYTAGSRMEIFLNGVSDASTTTTVPASIADTTHDFALGAFFDSAWTEFADGKMQDAILWNVALTGAEVLSLYNLYTTAPQTARGYSFFM